MMIKSDFLRVLSGYNFLEFPRMFGNPRQDIVRNYLFFLDKIKLNNGRAACFTSHNSYTEFNKMGDPIKMRHQNLFFDLDSPDKFENAWGDVITLCHFCNQYDLNYSVSFSGNKGFHFFIHLLPMDVIMNHKLRKVYYAIHDWIRTELGVRTLDQQTKDPKRLCRIPNTIHTSSGLYCVAIRDFDMSVVDVKEYARRPQKVINKYKPILNLMGFLKKFDIDPNSANVTPVTPHGYIDKVMDIKDEDFIRMISEVVWMPCLQRDLFTINPMHYTRFASAVIMKEIIGSYDTVLEMWHKMSEVCGYIDRFNAGVTEYQLKQIFERDYYKPTKESLCRNGLCLGKECPYWERCK